LRILSRSSSEICSILYALVLYLVREKACKGMEESGGENERRVVKDL